MRSALALASVAAVAAPSIAATAFDTRDDGPTAAARRAREVVDVLCDAHVRSGWKIDEEAASRALAWFDARARGEVSDAEPLSDEGAAAFAFLRVHGQSLDWVLLGDPRGLICRGAKHSERAAECAGADPIFAALEVHRAAALASMQTASAYAVLNTAETDSASNAADEIFEEASLDLADVSPTTLQGVLALLDYVESFNRGDLTVTDEWHTAEEQWRSSPDMWPDSYVDDEVTDAKGNEIELPFAFWLLRSVRAALAEGGAA